MINIFNNHPYFVILAIGCSLWVAWFVPSITKYHSFYEDLPKILHQYLVNLSGCVLGWFALSYFLFQRPSGTLTITDLIIVLVAYVGIAGYLPHLILNKGLKP